MLNLRKLTSLLLLMVATLALGVPGAASIAHAADYKPGAELHFHYAGVDEDGSDQHGEHSDDQGVGHGHPPFSAIEPALLSSSALPLLMIAGQRPQAWTARGLPTLTWTPQERPPRA